MNSRYHSYTDYDNHAFVCGKCSGSFDDCLRCGRCGRKAYPKEKPFPMEKNPLNYIPGLNLLSIGIHLVVEKTREGYICSGCRDDCKDCDC